MKNHKLDREEKAMFEEIENGDFKEVKSMKKEIASFRQSAIRALKKDTSITIRISSIELKKIKKESAVEGIPYQTLITSILHKYIVSKNVAHA